MKRLWYVTALLSAYPLLQVAATAYFSWHFSKVPDIETAPRLPNVRLLPLALEKPAVRAFLSKAASGGKDVVLLAGDSQIYGYFLAASDTVGRFLHEELGDARVINASKVAGSHRYPLAALKIALAAGIRPRALVVNVNPATAGREDSYSTDPPAMPFAMALLLSRETAERFVDLAKRALLSMRWQFDMHDVKSSPPGDGNYQIAALDADYYPREMLPAVEDNLRELLRWSAGRVDKVVVVASPHHYQPYLAPPYSYKWDTTAIMQRYMAVCKEFAHAICLDLSSSFGRERFHDLIHLNRGGHQELARLIASALRQAERRPPTAGAAIK